MMNPGKPMSERTLKLKIALLPSIAVLATGLTIAATMVKLASIGGELAPQSAEIIRFLQVFVAGASVFSAFGMFALGLKISAHIVGPVEQFERSLAALKDGRVEPIRLEKGDELAGLAETFNSALARSRLALR